jgi:hypothetical protein
VEVIKTTTTTMTTTTTTTTTCGNGSSPATSPVSILHDVDTMAWALWLPAGVVEVDIEAELPSLPDPAFIQDIPVHK